MNSECNKELSREDMAMKIKAYQFAVTDISLYLNTHPEDEKHFAYTKNIVKC